MSKRNIEDKYMVYRELGRGEFGPFRVTNLCIDQSSWELLAYKSISKWKLQTTMDVEDARREVDVAITLNIESVTPKAPKFFNDFDGGGIRIGDEDGHNDEVIEGRMVFLDHN